MATSKPVQPFVPGGTPDGHRHPGEATSGMHPPVSTMHEKVTRTPSSLPIGNPAGAPAGSELRLRLVPPGPVTKIRNVLFAFAVPNWKNASIKFAFNTKKRVA